MTRAQFPRVRANKPKTRSGCLRCKRQRVKCTEERPSCVRCSRAAAECEYPQFPTRPDPGEPQASEQDSGSTATTRQPSAAAQAKRRAAAAAATTTSGSSGAGSGIRQIDPDEVLSAALIRGVPLAFNLSYTECLDLDRYRYCIATRTTHSIGPEFLCQTVLREMPRDLVVRYSLIGFGALDRAVDMQLRTRKRGRFQTKDEFLRSMDSRNDAAGREAREHYDRAIRYHGMALLTLSRQMQMEQSRGPQVPVDVFSKYRALLVRTLLFVIFELRQFNSHGVSNLALAGMQSLRQMAQTAHKTTAPYSESTAVSQPTSDSSGFSSSIVSPRTGPSIDQRLEPQNTNRDPPHGNIESPLHNRLDEDGVKDAEYTLTRLAAVGTTGGRMVQRGILPAVLRDQNFDLAEPQYDLPIPEQGVEIFRRSWELQYNAWSIWFTGVDRAKLALDAEYALKMQKDKFSLLKQVDDWVPRVEERLRMHDVRSPFPMPLDYGATVTPGEGVVEGGLGVYSGLFALDGGVGSEQAWIDPESGMGGVGDSGFYEERFNSQGGCKSREDLAYERRALKEMVFRVHMSRLMVAMTDTSKAAELEEGAEPDVVKHQGGGHASPERQTVLPSVEVEHIDPALQGGVPQDKSMSTATTSAREAYVEAILRDETRLLVALAWELVQEFPPMEIHNYSFDTKALLVARIALGRRPRSGVGETHTREVDEEDGRMWEDAERIMRWFEED